VGFSSCGVFLWSNARVPFSSMRVQYRFRILDGKKFDELAHGAAAAEWLNQKAIGGEIEEVLLIADPNTLGEMRQHYHTKLRSKLVCESDKTLTGQPIDKIEAAIDAALPVSAQEKGPELCGPSQASH
jgi:hypothetical protein